MKILKGMSDFSDFSVFDLLDLGIDINGTLYNLISGGQSELYTVKIDTNDFTQAQGTLAITSRGDKNIPFYSALNGFSVDDTFQYNSFLNTLTSKNIDMTGQELYGDSYACPISFAKAYNIAGSGLVQTAVGEPETSLYRSSWSLDTDNITVGINETSQKLEVRRGNGLIASGISNNLEIDLATASALNFAESGGLQINPDNLTIGINTLNTLEVKRGNGLLASEITHSLELDLAASSGLNFSETGSLQANPDNVTIGINTLNKLEVKRGNGLLASDITQSLELDLTPTHGLEFSETGSLQISDTYARSLISAETPDLIYTAATGILSSALEATAPIIKTGNVLSFDMTTITEAIEAAQAETLAAAEASSAAEVATAVGAVEAELAGVEGEVGGLSAAMAGVDAAILALEIAGFLFGHGGGDTTNNTYNQITYNTTTVSGQTQIVFVGTD